MIKFRDLTKDDIEIRVGQAKENGCSLLLYKDARCDMAILDETVGSENWQREHYECKGNLFCRVGINVNYDDTNVPEKWIFKSDCGTESNTEAQKGEASDSFKRACVNWGIGRELYTAPFIWIDKKDIKELKLYKVGNKEVYRTSDKFAVDSIEIKNKQIVSLKIKNLTLKRVVFEMGKAAPTSSQKEDKPKVEYIDEVKQKTLIEMYKGDTEKILKIFKVDDLSKITEKQFVTFNQKLNEAKSKNANN